MKNIILIPAFLVVILGFAQCDKNKTDSLATLSDAEKSGLLYMLEEEKLARDVYIHLDELWNANQFRNIKESEKMHLAYVADVLDFFEIEYTILDKGEFNNPELKSLYEQMITEGELSQLSALKVGATIEDIDISDLENLRSQTSDSMITELYQRLQCGSENHIRAFVKGITNAGSNYQPQYISQQVYDQILARQNAPCH